MHGDVGPAQPEIGEPSALNLLGRYPRRPGCGRQAALDRAEQPLAQGGRAPAGVRNARAPRSCTSHARTTTPSRPRVLTRRDRLRQEPRGPGRCQLRRPSFTKDLQGHHRHQAGQQCRRWGTGMTSLSSRTHRPHLVVALLGAHGSRAHPWRSSPGCSHHRDSEPLLGEGTITKAPVDRAHEGDGSRP